MDQAKAHRTLDRLMRLLASEDYEGLCRLASGPTPEEIRAAVQAYPAKPVLPPVALESLMDVVEVVGSTPKTWYVGVDLWTKEEGRSDLTLEMHFSEVPGNYYDVEIDGLHVL